VIGFWRGNGADLKMTTKISFLFLLHLICGFQSGGRGATVVVLVVVDALVDVVLVMGAGVRAGVVVGAGIAGVV